MLHCCKRRQHAVCWVFLGGGGCCQACLGELPASGGELHIRCQAAAAGVSLCLQRLVALKVAEVGGALL